MLADVSFQDRRGILLSGPGAKALGPLIASGLGCSSLDLRRCRQEDLLDQMNQQCLAHDWPCLVRLAERRSALTGSSWLDAPGSRNSLLLADDYSTAVASWHAGFQVLSAGPRLPLGRLADHLRFLLPAYIQDLFRRHLSREIGQDHSYLHDIADWFCRGGGDDASFPKARGLLEAHQTNPAASFVELICHMVYEGELGAVRKGYRPRGGKKRPAVVYGAESGGFGFSVSIPAKAINRTLAARALPILPLAAVREALESQGAIVERSEASCDGCWHVDLGWWNEQVQLCLDRDESILNGQTALIVDE